ncbi:MAG: hypothetical protein N2748_05820 [candidate division WOR-3 bacterium]|nr:hypothetical protein [candidate division WOR-3 bacterium]
MQPDLLLADSLYQRGDYFNAITEYQRYLFFSAHAQQNDTLIYLVQKKLFLSYLNNNEFEKADTLLNALESKNQSIDNKFRQQLAQGFLKEKQYIKAKIKLIDWQARSLADNQQINYLLGFIALQEKDITTAEKYFKAAQDSFLIRKIYLIKNLRYKNVTLSQIFSSIIPGSGEIYAGNIKLGFLSLLANSLSLYGTIYTYKKKQYLDSAILFSFFFTRFYNGSRNNARDFSIKHNEILYQRHLDDIEKYLKEITVLN